jgi:RNA polymerase sigma factor (sigma-70 family)
LTLTDKNAERQSDAELVAEARRAEGAAGDAFGELVRRYQRMVYALALSLVRASDADDVAQDAFLRAFRNLDLLADPARFGVWLRRITFGVAIDHVRADRARNGSVVTAGEGEASGDPLVEVPDPTPSPLDRVEQREVVGSVLAALERMPARYRVPLTLYHIDGLTHAKVARALGVPEGTVRSLVARARQKLARLLAHAPEAQDMTDNSFPLRSSADVLNDSAAESPRFLHVLNGDAVRVTLEHSDVPGAFAVYAEVLHEGPVLPDSGTRAWREARSRYLSARDYLPYADALRNLEAWDGKLEAFGDYDEVVLWFEHDLFDQLLLVRHLDWFSRRPLGRTALSLICIGEFPGFEPFHGLGQLNPEQLTSLLGTREPVSAAQLALGARAWRAFTASDPLELDALARTGDTRVLAFLAGALQRFLEEYPALSTGLPRTERQILELLAAEPMTPKRLFVAMQRLEERVFMGDTTFWMRVLDVASGPTPLVSLDVEPLDDDPSGGLALPNGTVSITDAGRAVLAGAADWVRLNGFDRWLGGVHLSAAPGGDVQWRYDRESTALVRT